MEVDRISADIDCEQAQEEFSALLDGELNAEDQERVESHLAQCSSCLRELSGVQQVQRTYVNQPMVTAPEELTAEPISSPSAKPVVRLTPNLKNHPTRSYRAMMTAGGMLAIVLTIWLLMVSLNTGIEPASQNEADPSSEGFSVEFISPEEVDPALDSIRLIGNDAGTHWIQEGYNRETTTTVNRDNAIFESAELSNSEVAEKIADAESIIFQYEGVWFKVE